MKGLILFGCVIGTLLTPYPFNVYFLWVGIGLLAVIVLSWW